MKKITYGFITIAALAFTLTACQNNKPSTPDAAATNGTNVVTQNGAPNANGVKIAYVNLDTLDAKYEFFKTKKEGLLKEQKSMEAELERLGKTIQSEYTKFQQKAQAGTLTQAEGEAAQKKLGQMQQNFESKQTELGNKLLKKQEDLNKELKKRLDDFLAEYNKDMKYDFIFSYVNGGSFLYVNPTYDITNDVLKGLNALPNPAE